MAWSQLTNDATVLDSGNKVQVECKFTTIPFVVPSREEVIDALNASGKVVVTAFREGWTVQLGGAALTVELQVTGPVAVGELKADILNALNSRWNTWGAQIQSVGIDVGFRPGDLLPSVNTTVLVVGVAVVVLVGWLAFKEVT